MDAFFYDFAKNVFPKLLEEGQINTFTVSEYWNDIGTISQYKQSVQDVFNGVCQIKHGNITKTNLGSYVCGNSKLPNNLRVLGNNVIGNNCKIGEYVTLKSCIVLDNAEIKPGSELDNCIVLPVQQTSFASGNVSLEKDIVVTA